MSEEMKGLIEKIAETVEKLPEGVQEPMLKEYINKAEGARMALEYLRESRGA